MGPFYQSSYEYESVNDKNFPHNISTATSANVVAFGKYQTNVPENDSR